MDTGQDLDRALAEALGERAGWECPCAACGCLGEGEPPPHCPECWAEGCTVGASPQRIAPPPYSTSWEAAGRLVEEMRRRGYGFEIEIALEGGHVAQVIHYNRERGTCWKGASASGASLPEAIARAALRALGERGEG
jgi:hypothetical protein